MNESRRNRHLSNTIHLKCHRISEKTKKECNEEEKITKKGIKEVFFVTFAHINTPMKKIESKSYEKAFKKVGISPIFENSRYGAR